MRANASRAIMTSQKFVRTFEIVVLIHVSAQKWYEIHVESFVEREHSTFHTSWMTVIRLIDSFIHSIACYGVSS